MFDLENNTTGEKMNLHNKYILSYLSVLEKFYEQSQDKSNQKRLFRINKAINSIIKYSNCKVSSFNFKSSKTQNVENEDSIINSNIKDCHAILEFPSEKENDIDNILLLIEKELKENGINENNINNSFLSTSKKFLNSLDNLDYAEKNSSINEHSSKAQDNLKINLNKRRLSNLFIKLELKLKTFLQENNMKKILINEEKQINGDVNVHTNEKNYNNCTYSSGGKLARSPSKLPDVINSFFSDKNKVNSILQKVKKQRRKSVMDFNMKYCQLSKDVKETKYVDDSDDKDKDRNAKKRKKIIPSSAQAALRNKASKNLIKEKVSNFCELIDEKEEDKEEIEEINAFDNFIKESEKMNMNDDNKMVNEKPDIINSGNDSFYKITSSLNSGNEFHFNNKETNNNVISNNIIDKENTTDDCHFDNCNFYVGKDSVFNNENECCITIKNNENSMLDDEILMKSSKKKETNNSQNKENSKESEESCSNKSENNINNIDERYDILKYINDSKSRVNYDGNEEEFEKSVSFFGKSSSVFRQQKSSFQREIARADNINDFCMNSILSPLKEVEITYEKTNKKNAAIKNFTKFNSRFDAN